MQARQQVAGVPVAEVARVSALLTSLAPQLQTLAMVAPAAMSALSANPGDEAVQTAAVGAIACGIYGSDLPRRHWDELAAIAVEVGYDGIFRSNQIVVLGHEFTGEILRHSKRTRRFCRPAPPSPPSRCCGAAPPSTPPGGQPPRPTPTPKRCSSRKRLPSVPNGLAVDLPALTEPMAVALHSVRRSRSARGRS